MSDMLDDRLANHSIAFDWNELTLDERSMKPLVEGGGSTSG